MMIQGRQSSHQCSSPVLASDSTLSTTVRLVFHGGVACNGGSRKKIGSEPAGTERKFCQPQKAVGRIESCP
jgi:hypothetical protein